MSQEVIEFDVIIAGAGPAGLSCAIQLAQHSQRQDLQLSIAVVEKSAAIGAHLLSGAALDPRALNELIPDWQERGAPLDNPITEDAFLFLTKNKGISLPVPRQMRNRNNYIISLDQFARWLAQQAEALNVQIFPGFAGDEVEFDEQGQVCGIITGDMGIDKSGQPGPQFQPGVKLRAKQTILAEGCRGSLTEKIIKHFDLRKNAEHQTYAVGIKELWEIPTEKHKRGKVIHTAGWPLDAKTYGGSFLYFWNENWLAAGFITALDYQNPYTDPYEEFQKFKTHPAIKPFFEGGRRLEYGARALNEGGWQSIPKLSFPGGLLIGDCAGFLNVPKIKGTHNAMKSGMLAADLIAETYIAKKHLYGELITFTEKVKNSWVGRELYLARNIRPSFRHGLIPGLSYSAFDTYILRGRAPWTFKHGRPDYQCLKPAKGCKKINYPKHDGKITFDKLDSVFLSNTLHEENQPCHLVLIDPKQAIETNLKIYDSPESRYCPAGVYEIVTLNGRKELQINATNCVHCKTCDIKDPLQNIRWEPPQGGEGPNYQNM